MRLAASRRRPQIAARAPSPALGHAGRWKGARSRPQRMQGKSETRHELKDNTPLQKNKASSWVRGVLASGMFSMALFYTSLLGPYKTTAVAATNAPNQTVVQVPKQGGEKQYHDMKSEPRDRSRQKRRVLFSRPSYLNYKLQRLLQLSIAHKICVLILFSIVVTFVIAVMYKVSSGSPLDIAIFKSYAVVTNAPGELNDVTNEKGIVTAGVLNLAFFMSLFTFAVFLGLIVTDIEDRLYEMKSSSSYQLFEQQHLVMLGWNRYSIPILRAVQESTARPSRTLMGIKKSGRKKVVVIIANKEKEAMDQAIQESSLDHLRVISRKGDSTVRQVLENAAVGEAEGVIILQDEDRDLDDTHNTDYRIEVGSLLNLNSISSTKDKPLNVVIQSNLNRSEDPKHPLRLAEELANHGQQTRNDNVVLLPSQENVGRVVALSALQFDFWKVFDRILSHPTTTGIGNVSVQELPAKLRNLTFKEISLRSTDSWTPMGYLNQQSGAIKLNPGPSAKPVAGEKLVVIGGGSLRVKQAHVPGGTRDTRIGTETCPRQIVVLNVDEANPVTVGVLSALLESAHPDCTFTFVTKKQASCGSKWKDERIREFLVDEINHQTLVDCGVEAADSIVVLQDHSRCAGHEDAQSKLISLFLFDIFRSSRNSEDHPPPKMTFLMSQSKVLEEMRDAVFSGSKFKTRIEIISHEEVVSKLFTMACSQPELNPLFQELLSKKGCKLYFVDAVEYLQGFGKESKPTLDYACLCEKALDANDTLLGYIQNDSFTMVINPSSKERSLPLELDKTKLIILSEHGKF